MRSLNILITALVLLFSTMVYSRNIYIRPNGTQTQYWTNIVDDDVTNDVVTLGAANSISSYTAVAANTNIYFAPGTYYLSATAGLTLGENVKFYGGFKATDSNFDLATRPLEDKDGNGIVEPWEFKYETIITHEASSTHGFTAAGAGFRMAVISGTNAELNGITLTDFNYNNSTGKASAINLGVAGTPSAANNVIEKAGILRLCTLRKLKSTGTTSNSGVIFSTNKYSLIDQCLIEECVATGANSPSAVFLDTYGGTIKSSVLRNNANGSTGAFGAVYASAAASSDMDAIIENCVIYNNFGFAQGLRGVGQTNKRGIQIINSTIVNNQSGNASSANSASVELITSGTIANCILVGDFNQELRANATNNYVVNTAYEGLTGTLNGSGNVSGKVVADYKFVQPTAFYGAMIPDYTTPFDQSKYDAIRQANFKLQDATSVAVINEGVKTLGATYSFGSPATTVNLTATIPAVDGLSVERFGKYNLGAYQETAELSTGNAMTITNQASMVSVTINSGGSLTVNPGKQLTISGTMANSGTLNILSNSADGTATILTPATISGSGATYNVEQFISSSATGPTGRNWYISSPLSAASTNTITTATGNGLVYYNGSTWVDEGATMEVMKGYIAKSPAQNTTINFTGGTLNTGDKSVTNLPLGFNLVGNPYASYVDFAQATKTNVANSIWYRSKKEGTYNFHTYNVTGGISVKDGTAIIPPMQSFWIKTTSATNEFGFTNAMRSHQDQSVLSNRLKAPKASTQQLLRLQVSNGSYSDETVLYSDSHALNTYDEYDSQKMFNNISVVPEIFTQLASEKLVINGMQELPLNVEMPLGFTTLQANQFTISATEVKNFVTDVRVILSDKSTNPAVETDLTEGQSYSFYADATPVSANRFTLMFRAPNLSTNLTHTPALKAKVYVTDTNKINIETETQCNYSIYDIVGSIVTSGNTENTALAGKAFNKGMYIVKLDNQHTGFTTKVIIE